MVTHIVMWNLKEGALGHSKTENALEMKQKLEGLVGKIDGLISAEVGVNYNPKGMDVCLLSKFVDAAAQDAYQVHPLHLAVREFVHQVIESRVVVDYES